MGIALGVVLGSIMQLLVSTVGLIGLGFDYRFKIFWRNKGFRKVLRLLPPRSLDQAIDYFNQFVEINLASGMSPGTIRAYQQASSLSLMPVNLIGVAISNAAFPQMTERLNTGQVDLFKKELQSVLRVIIWLALPVAMITYFARGYIVNFIKNGGDPLIAGLLGALVIAILFRTIYHIAARTFYAQQDTRTPLYISIISILLNIALAVWFTKSLNMGAYGLAWAQSIVAVIEVGILFTIMAGRTPGIFDKPFVHAVARMASASGFMGLITYVLVLTFQLQKGDQSFLATFPKFTIIATVSFAAYVWFSKLLKLREADPIINRARRILFARRT